MEIHTGMMLVKKNDGLVSTVLIKDEVMEPAFFMTDALSLHPKISCPVAVVSQYLTYQIIKFPHDFRSHIQRIYLLIQQQNTTALYGALFDLFLVLGSNGLALRQRMLFNAQSVLTELEFDRLQQTLESGLTGNTDIPKPTQAVLNKALSNNQLFIEKVAQQNMTPSNAVEEASSFLEYGQFDQAREILEEAIISTPRQLELHHDLLEIFQTTRDSEQFIVFYERLLESDVALPMLWKEMANEFGYERSL
jgi:tetratricopeptide (TPR) repeat protein